MTEVEWLASTDPEEIKRPNPCIKPDQMLQFLRAFRRVDKTKLGRRKLRLFACACCRRFWSSLSEESREALDIAERYADGEASKKDLGYAWRISVRQYGRGPRNADAIAGHVAEASAMTAAALVPMVCYSVFANTPRQFHELWGEQFQQAIIVNDLFGNPFRTVPAKLASQFSKVDSVRRLAEEIYRRNTFDDLSDLLTELQSAGCDAPELLEHCRQPQHFRGCWLVDHLRGIS
ncbi:MAG: hypothetical protein KDA69_15910 [Planctomycetaceae bacterium]|nr:hypothetical protein [Planctomycetaceae bacterium]